MTMLHEKRKYVRITLNISDIQHYVFFKRECLQVYIIDYVPHMKSELKVINQQNKLFKMNKNVIGILTHYHVANFGANLQALSTQNFLIKEGYEPIFIRYDVSNKTKSNDQNIQNQCHKNFIDKHIRTQTCICKSLNDLRKLVEIHKIEAIIVGSDAVVQHHPFFTRIRKGKRKPFFIMKISRNSIYPNMFWGNKISNKIPMAMMSVSCQNSNYKVFSNRIKKSMRNTLSSFKYISARDTWTRDMFCSILGKKYDIEITPDPVFSFNKNSKGLVPAKEFILNKFSIPENYILISLHSQVLSPSWLEEFKQEAQRNGLECIALPMPNGINFKHSFDFKIDIPLSTIDWYALIKYSKGYIGSNMHPIVVALHNNIPCFSIDNWGRTNFTNNKIHDGSSKVEHILNIFELNKNHTFINNGKCDISIKTVIDSIQNFPLNQIMTKSSQMQEQYDKMMKNILDCLFTN